MAERISTKYVSGKGKGECGLDIGILDWMGTSRQVGNNGCNWRCGELTQNGDFIRGYVEETTFSMQRSKSRWNARTDYKPAMRQGGQWSGSIKVTLQMETRFEQTSKRFRARIWAHLGNDWKIKSFIEGEYKLQVGSAEVISKLWNRHTSVFITWPF